MLVRVNPNYTITICDSSAIELEFRDLTGEDLEVIEWLIERSKTESDDNTALVQILGILNTQRLDFSRFPKRVLVELFEAVKSNILSNYVSKVEWLRICFIIQKGSFVNLHEMEKVPMSKFIAMYEIYKEMNSSTEPEVE